VVLVSVFVRAVVQWFFPVVVGTVAVGLVVVGSVAVG
jgi:hypothetical protein